MKKKLLSILLLATMVATMLVGCGDTNDTNTETTNDTTENTEVVENTEGVNLIPSTEEETPTFSDDMSWKFPSGMEGFTDKWIYADDETWSYNQTHYVDSLGNVMNFMWNGPTELGETAFASERTLDLGDKNNNYELHAWTYGEVDAKKFKEDLAFTKETWTSFAGTVIPYVNGGFYDIKTTDTTIEVIFEVANDTVKGYNYYIVDLDRKTCYQFAYHEKIEVFDDERALEVIESLDFWDYEE